MLQRMIAIHRHILLSQTIELLSLYFVQCSKTYNGAFWQRETLLFNWMWALERPKSERRLSVLLVTWSMYKDSSNTPIRKILFLSKSCRKEKQTKINEVLLKRNTANNGYNFHWCLQVIQFGMTYCHNILYI